MGKNNYDHRIEELRLYEAEFPHLSPIIDLNRKILAIQESVRASLGPAPAVSNWGLDNLNAGTHVLSGNPPVIPDDLFRQAAKELAQVFSEIAGADFPVNLILELPQLDGDNVSAISTDLIEDRLDLKTLSEGTSFNTETIAFFLHSLLVPFYEREAEAYSSIITNREIPWTAGFCPICGVPPRYGVIYDEKGFRKLYCGLCRTEWPYPRHKCPICENPERVELRQMTLGEDRAHLAEACNNCRSYLKTTDERKLQRECVPLIEDIVTAPLDLAAVKEGYNRAA